MANWRHQAITYMTKKIRRNNSKYIFYGHVLNTKDDSAFRNYDIRVRQI